MQKSDIFRDFICLFVCEFGAFPLIWIYVRTFICSLLLHRFSFFFLWKSFTHSLAFPLKARSSFLLFRFSLVLILSDNYFKIRGYKMKCNKWTKIEHNTVQKKKRKWLNFWLQMLVKYVSEQWRATAALVRFFLLFSQFSIFNMHKTRNKMLE